MNNKHTRPLNYTPRHLSRLFMWNRFRKSPRRKKH